MRKYSSKNIKTAINIYIFFLTFNFLFCRSKHSKIVPKVSKSIGHFVYLVIIFVVNTIYCFTAQEESNLSGFTVTVCGACLHLSLFTLQFKIKHTGRAIQPRKLHSNWDKCERLRTRSVLSFLIESKLVL